jgi:hypothetical protein
VAIGNGRRASGTGLAGRVLFETGVTGGRSTSYATLLAIEEINAAGGILDCRWSRCATTQIKP